MPRIEVLPADELPAATGPGAGPPQRDAAGRFLPGNRAGRARRLKVGALGHSALPVADDFLPYERWGRRYGAHRRAELAAAHGGSLSAGVGALIESAAMQLAAARYAQDKGATTGDLDSMKRASDLANASRQNELAAWELAAKEAPTRRRTMSLTDEILASAPRPEDGGT